MPLVYAAVGYAGVTVAEHAAYDGNFGEVARAYAESASGTEGKVSYTVDDYAFYFLCRRGFLYVAVADAASGRGLPAAFLDRLEAEFGARHAEALASGPPPGEGCLNATFGKTLAGLMAHANSHPEEYSRLAAVQARLDAVKSVVVDNMEKVVARGDDLALLTDKTDNLQFEADRFVRTGRTLQRKMWWSSCKMKIVIALAVVLIAVVIFLIACFSGGNCLK